MGHNPVRVTAHEAMTLGRVREMGARSRLDVVAGNPRDGGAVLTVLRIPTGLAPLEDVARLMLEAERDGKHDDDPTMSTLQPIATGGGLRRRGYPHVEWLRGIDDLNMVLDAPGSPAVDPETWKAWEKRVERHMATKRSHSIDITCGRCTAANGKLSQRVVAKVGRFADPTDGKPPLWLMYKEAAPPQGELEYGSASEVIACQFCGYSDGEDMETYTYSPAVQAVFETQIMGTPRSRISIKRVTENAVRLTREQVLAILTTGTYIPQHA